MRSEAEDEFKQLSQKPKAVVMRRYRSKLKVKQDEIAQHEKEESERIMKVKHVAHNQGLDIESDNWGRDIGVEFDLKNADLGLKPQSNRPRRQYETEPEHNELMGGNVWGTSSNEPTKPKRSIQDIMREFDTKHTER